MRRPHHLADLGELCGLGHLRDPEVGDHRAARRPLEKDVVGFDVAVDDAPRVRVGERPGDLLDHLRRRRDRHRAARAHAMRERLPVHVRHREEDVPVDLVDPEDRDDVGMRQLGRRPRLAHEALAKVGALRERRREHLERHVPVQLHLAREIHHPHPAASELALQRVLPRQGALEGDEVEVEGVGHAAILRREAARGKRVPLSECRAPASRLD